MAMMYPETSPSAPVSREELAAILAAQGLSGTQQGDASSVDIGALFGGSTPNDTAPAPSPGSTPGMPGALNAPSAAFDPGAMTTSNASMVSDAEDPDGSGRGFSDVSPFGRTGDDSSDRSQSQQATDRAALAESVANRGGFDITDPAGMPSAGNVTPGGFNAFAGAVPGAPGAPMTSGSTFAGRFGAVNDFPDSFSDRWGGMPTGAPPATTVVTPNTTLPEQVVTAPAITPTGRTPLGSPGRTPGAPPGAPDVVAPGYDLGSPAPGGTDFGPGAYGGFTSGSGNTGGFGAGYSGSADMGNTQGAAGFTAGAPGGGFDVGAGSFSGGGAVGGFGGTDAGPGGDGAGAGAGTGSGDSGPGSGADPGGGVG
jgi:hypothetical protein